MSRVLRAAVKAATGHCIFCLGNLWPGQRTGFLVHLDASQGRFHTQCLTDAKRTLHPVWMEWQSKLRQKEEDEL